MKGLALLLALGSCLIGPCTGKTNIGSAVDELPTIAFFLIDDFGWADAGWHRPSGYKEVQTPVMDGLVQEGIELDRNYVYKFCSPTRSAIQEREGG